MKAYEIQTGYEGTAKFGRDIASMESKIRSLLYQAEQYRLIAAKYKADFFGKDTLARKLDFYINENKHSTYVGGFDGFGYSSLYDIADFRTLEDMLEECAITEQEYSFLDAIDAFL